MGSLLDAVNVEPNKIEVTDELPIRIGDVSIMSLRTLCRLLEDDDDECDISIYYVYGIVGPGGTDSTIENLQVVGLDWYKQLNVQTTETQTFTSNDKNIFGGPLYDVDYSKRLGYHFMFSSAEPDTYYYSHEWYRWHVEVDKSVYVAVVRAHE